MPTRYLGSAQPYRGKLTRAKLRALRLLGARHPAPVSLGQHAIRPQTVRALARVGVIRSAGAGHVLTRVGEVAVARYLPRRRACAGRSA